MKIIKTFVAMAAVMAMSAGCGGGGGGGGGGSGVCSSAFDACGGSPIGDWKASAFCFSQLPPCTSKYSFDQVPTQTFSLTAAGNAQITSNGQAHASATVDLDCAIQGATMCSQLDSDDADGMTSCIAKGSGTCDCDYNSTVNTSTAATYTVSGSQLTISVGQSSITYGFCVQGNTLKLSTGNLVYTLQKQ